MVFGRAQNSGAGKDGVAVLLIGVTVKRDIDCSSDFSSV